ncbi:hypothetical protein [Streptomyces sp. NPDC005281]|uniref:hypothetical protein n=1 Tax=Streptomyces sp. NPDC005281 TaxID=3155712 RepID=UPI0033ADB171
MTDAGFITERPDTSGITLDDAALEDLIRMQLDVDLSNLPTLLDLVALGITVTSWRNGPVENWHAEGRLSDGDMMRVNSHTTQAVRRRLTGWAIEFNVTSASSSSMAALDVEALRSLTGLLLRWLARPDRKLPVDMTLGGLAHTKAESATYREHASLQLDLLVRLAEMGGVRFGLLSIVAQSLPFCSSWWLHPTWPDRVERFVSALDHSSDPFWGRAAVGGSCWAPNRMPCMTAARYVRRCSRAHGSWMPPLPNGLQTLVSAPCESALHL